MDPVAHTLVGATLAETGLRRTTRFATATLIIGANLPDVDALFHFADMDTSLFYRRGWTHGALAMVVMPILLAAVMYGLARWRRSDQSVRFRSLLGLAYLSFLTHPFLDWLNTYGVRLLMPFDGQWFYGDALFIVDPWMWLLMASAAVLARSHGRLSMAGWLVLATAATALVTATRMVPLATKIIWGLGVGAIVVARSRAPTRARVRRVARVALALLTVYICAMLVGTSIAREQAKAWLVEQRVETEAVMAGPIPANPFVRDVIALTARRYLFVRLDWLAEPKLAFSDPPLPRREPDRIVRAALGAEEVRGLRNWLRFPTYRVIEEQAGYRVVIQDVRYSRRDDGFGTAVVRLDEELKPR